MLHRSSCATPKARSLRCRVRERSMAAIVDVARLLMAAQAVTAAEASELLTLMTAALLRQALERISRIRQAAAAALRSLLEAQVVPPRRERTCSSHKHR